MEILPPPAPPAPPPAVPPSEKHLLRHLSPPSPPPPPPPPREKAHDDDPPTLHESDAQRPPATFSDRRRDIALTRRGYHVPLAHHSPPARSESCIILCASCDGQTKCLALLIFMPPPWRDTRPVDSRYATTPAKHGVQHQALRSGLPLRHGHRSGIRNRHPDRGPAQTQRVSRTSRRRRAGQYVAQRWSIIH